MGGDGTPTVRIREARPGEEGAIVELYGWLFDAPGGRPAGWDERWAREALGRAIASPEAAVLVAEDRSGGLVGLCTAYLELDSVRFGRRCWVEDLAVDPARRSRGIGARLLGAARGWARERGATHLELDTGEARLDAQRFYEREGASRRSISYAWELDQG